MARVPKPALFIVTAGSPVLDWPVFEEVTSVQADTLTLGYPEPLRTLKTMYVSDHQPAIAKAAAIQHSEGPDRMFTALLLPYTRLKTPNGYWDCHGIGGIRVVLQEVREVGLVREQSQAVLLPGILAAAAAGYLVGVPAHVDDGPNRGSRDLQVDLYIAPPKQFAAQVQAALEERSRRVSPTGWYPDPSRRHEQRYWDGSTWTEHVSDNGTMSTDLL